MRVPFLDLRIHDKALRHELADAYGRVMARGHFVLGQEVEAFEAEFAAYCGKKHCVGVASGTDAIRLIIMGYGIDGEVIVPSNTYVATWMAVPAPALVVPVEPDESFNIDPTKVEAAITPRTQAILAVHLYGRCADVHVLRGIANRYGLKLILDACQAHGIRQLGDAAAFSFYPTKNLGCFGDGGAVVTDDDALANRVRALRNYGSVHKNRNDFIGINSRLDELQAAMLRVKLPRLDGWNVERRKIAEIYDGALGIEDSMESVRHLYVARFEDRDTVRARLMLKGVETAIHYPTPPHRQPCYVLHAVGRNRLPVGPFPIADQMAEEVLSLPVTVSEAVAKYVAEICASL